MFTKYKLPRWNLRTTFKLPVTVPLRRKPIMISFGVATFVTASFLAVTPLISLDSKIITSQPPKVTLQELANHTTIESGVWVTINGKVYDLTNFLSRHPGGAKIIMKHAGKDASKLFNKVHPLNVIEEYLEPENFIGDLDVPEDYYAGTELKTPDPPALSKIYNLNDFEYVASKLLSPDAWAYYSGGADDEVTMRENHSAYQRIFFNPKVLVDVREIDISSTFLGVPTSAPFYVSAAALAKLGHPDGELSIARGCDLENIIQMISSAASYPFKQIAKETPSPKWFQVYVIPDRPRAYQRIEECNDKDSTIKGIFVTVDTPLLGRREKDYKFRYAEDNDEDDDEDPLKSFHDPGLTWKDIDEFKSRTHLPVAIKGVQSVQDVLKAIDHKVDAVVLSNHGGRQLEYSKAPIEVLAEVHKVLKEKQLEDKIEIYIDGGIKRGTDIIKALCLGAKGVGLGRPFLYANTGYGEKGVKKAIQLLKNEMILTMKLLGVSKISDLNDEFVDIKSLGFKSVHPDLHQDLYQPLSPPSIDDVTD